MKFLYNFLSSTTSVVSIKKYIKHKFNIPKTIYKNKLLFFLEPQIIEHLPQLQAWNNFVEFDILITLQTTFSFEEHTN